MRTNGVLDRFYFTCFKKIIHLPIFCFIQKALHASPFSLHQNVSLEPDEVGGDPRWQSSRFDVHITKLENVDE